VVFVRLLTIGSIEPIAGFEDRLKLEFDLLKEDGFEITYKKIANHCYVDKHLWKIFIIAINCMKCTFKRTVTYGK
jgi:hypothetical protein